MGLLHASRVQRKVSLGIVFITAAETLNIIYNFTCASSSSACVLRNALKLCNPCQHRHETLKGIHTSVTEVSRHLENPGLSMQVL